MSNPLNGADSPGKNSTHSNDSLNYHHVPKNDSFVVVDHRISPSAPPAPHDNRPPSGGIHLYSDSSDNIIVSAQPILPHAVAVEVRPVDVIDEHENENTRITDSSPLRPQTEIYVKPSSPKVNVVVQDPGKTKGDYVSFDHGENSPSGVTAGPNPSGSKRTVELGGRSTLPALKHSCSLCCCVVGLSDYTWELTTGFQSGCHALCYEHSLAACRPVGEQCFMAYGTSGLVKPSSECDCFTQIFNLHCFLGYPASDVGAVQNIKPGDSGDKRVLEPDMRIVPCGAFCCEITSLYWKFPQCLSVYTNLTAACFHLEFIGLRPTCLEDTSSFDDMGCVCFRGSIVMVPPNVLLKGIVQSWCFDTRLALPCTEEVPFMLFCLPYCSVCVNLKPVFACCNTVEQLVAASKV